MEEAMPEPEDQSLQDPPETHPADTVPENWVLRRTYQVADGPNDPLVTLPAGTPRGAIPEPMQAQLCAEHFTEPRADDGGAG